MIIENRLARILVAGWALILAFGLSGLLDLNVYKTGLV